MRGTQHRFYCGTSGWNYKHWIDVLYPRGLPTSKWLQRYAEEFDTVEINASFYRLPPRETFEKWRSVSPEGFTFAVKASRYLTHIKKLEEPEEPLERLMTSAAGLGEKLGPVLYQFPPGWEMDLGRLECFLAMLPRTKRHVFEFRNPSWHNEKLFSLLRKYGAAYCVMSSPGLPFHLVRTADFAYVRMHDGGAGRGGNYSQEHLEWWAEQCRELLREGDVYVYFNNDAYGNAVRNARTLKELL